MPDETRIFLTDVGSRIRQARTAQQASLEQMALLTGISAPALSLIENGKRDPRLTTLAKIADALRVPLGELVEARPADETVGSPKSDGGYDLGDYE
ncbi:MAG: helix-turn-helix transcriptional regulator [Paracoccus sp. (in: a-proteobacteria)]|nr:helix-turn-helix transcriptional regulator [Paracoccus sp. (in: a-proteobacteria)]